MKYINCNNKPFDLGVIFRGLIGKVPGQNITGIKIRSCTIAANWKPETCATKSEWEAKFRQCIHLGTDGKMWLNVVADEQTAPEDPPCGAGIANNINVLLNMSFVRTTDGEMAVYSFGS